jgi:putative oxidoreductase
MNGSPLSRISSRLPFAPHLASLALRLALGPVMMTHGLSKLRNGVEGFSGLVESLGAPFPLLTAYVVVAIEVVGGASLLIGLLARVWSTLIALFMVFTTLLVKLEAGLVAGQGQGTGAELDVLILAGALAITLMGPGTISVDHLIGLEPPAAAGPAGAAGTRVTPGRRAGVR